MQLINPATLQLETTPQSITLTDGMVWQNPMLYQFLAAGWMTPNMPLPVADGYVRQWATPAWTEVGDGTANPNFTDVPIATVQAQAQQAQHDAIQAAGFITLAQDYRGTLQALFGTGAEFNHQISQAYVVQYFAALSQPLTPTQTAQSVLLEDAFQVLSQFSPTKTTWDLPWALI
jgi:hypothetical protein